MIKKTKYGKAYLGKCYKRGFLTKKSAKLWIKGRRKFGGKAKNVYFCNKCNAWHATQLTQGEYKEKVMAWRLIKHLEKDLGLAK